MHVARLSKREFRSHTVRKDRVATTRFEERSRNKVVVWIQSAQRLVSGGHNATPDEGTNSMREVEV